MSDEPGPGQGRAGSDYLAFVQLASISAMASRQYVRVLMLAVAAAQERAISAPHQGQPGLDQADGAAAQIMSLPRSFGNPPAAEQDLGNGAVAVSLGSSVQRPQSEREPLAAFQGQHGS